MRDDDVQELLMRYAEGVQFPAGDAPGVLSLLKTRSRIAEIEAQLDEAELARLEDADGLFLHNAAGFYDRLSALGDQETLRERSGAREGHWWWHLEKLA